MNAIVTVIGKDRVGIMAGVCVAFEKTNVNVLDISQTILKDMFTNNCNNSIHSKTSLLYNTY